MAKAISPVRCKLNAKNILVTMTQFTRKANKMRTVSLVTLLVTFMFAGSAKASSQEGFNPLELAPIPAAIDLSEYDFNGFMLTKEQCDDLLWERSRLCDEPNEEDMARCFAAFVVRCNAPHEGYQFIFDDGVSRFYGFVPETKLSI